jgi:hypothetical protein
MSLLKIQNFEHKYKATKAQLPKKNNWNIILHRNKAYTTKGDS